MNALYALYAEPQSAERAVEALRRAGPDAGFDAEQVVVITGEPMDVPSLNESRRKTPQFAMAALGGLLGGIGIYWFLSYTQKSYPIFTGAMPLAPWWTNGIIIYECAAMGAVIATVLVLLIGGKILKREASLCDPEVWNGKILVGVTDPPPSSRSKLEALLNQTGAQEVKEFRFPKS